MQVEPMQSKLKAPGTKRLKRKSNIWLTNCAFNFNLRRYKLAEEHVANVLVVQEQGMEKGKATREEDRKM